MFSRENFVPCSVSEQWCTILASGIRRSDTGHAFAPLPRWEALWVTVPSRLSFFGRTHQYLLLFDGAGTIPTGRSGVDSWGVHQKCWEGCARPHKTFRLSFFYSHFLLLEKVPFPASGSIAQWESACIFTMPVRLTSCPDLRIASKRKNDSQAILSG